MKDLLLAVGTAVPGVAATACSIALFVARARIRQRNARERFAVDGVAHVVVVGAGMTGCAAAKHVTQLRPGMRVVLVGPSEPPNRAAFEDRTTFGAHYDEGRIYRCTDPHPVWAGLAQRSIKRFEQIEADARHAGAATACSFFRACGHLVVGVRGSEHMADVHANAKAQGVTVTRLDAAQLRDRFPYLRFDAAVPAGTELEGVLEETGAGWLSPRRLVEAQSRIAVSRGCTLVRATVARIDALGALEAAEAAEAAKAARGIRPADASGKRCGSGGSGGANKGGGDGSGDGSDTSNGRGKPKRLLSARELGLFARSNRSFSHDPRDTTSPLATFARKCSRGNAVENAEHALASLREVAPAEGHDEHQGLGDDQDRDQPREDEEEKEKEKEAAEKAQALQPPVARFRVQLENGGQILAERVIVAAGAFVNAKPLVPACGGATKLELQLLTAQVAKLRLTESDAATLHSMPSVIFKGPSYWTYILPPITYPDGNTYIKLGGGLFSAEAHKPVARRPNADMRKPNVPGMRVLDTADDVVRWYRGGGDPSSHAMLLRFAAQLLPGICPLGAHSDACVTAHTPSRLPYVGAAGAGDSCITVCAGGNGYAAKSSDELGRITALSALALAKSDDIPPEFKPRFVNCK